MKPFYAQLGSISHGTMRTQELIPTFLDELEALNEERRRHYADKDKLQDILEEHKRVDKFVGAMIANTDHCTDGIGVIEDHPYWESERSQSDLEDLFDELQDFAPPYCYFGSHIGDGADYGFWMDHEALEEDFDGLRVDDLSEVPNDYEGEVLHVNDHGNMTLWAVENGEFTEIWSVV